MVSLLVVWRVPLGCGTCSRDCCEGRCGACCELCCEVYCGFAQVRHGVPEAVKFVIKVIQRSDNLFYFEIVRDGLAYHLCYISLELRSL